MNLRSPLSRRLAGGRRLHFGRRAPIATVVAALVAGGLALTTMTALGAFNAVITQNGTFTAGSIVLKETQGANTCYSTGGTNTPFTTNSSSCTTIDVFGAPTGQVPGGTASSQSMTFQNVGSANASSFTVAAPTCSAAGDRQLLRQRYVRFLWAHRRDDRQRRVGLLLPVASERLPSPVEHLHARDARYGDRLDADNDRLGARSGRDGHRRRQDSARCDEHHE